ncbi:MAG: hypothetical protein AMXMBFR77_27990 [Phycisphaerales bacterium]
MAILTRYARRFVLSEDPACAPLPDRAPDTPGLVPVEDCSTAEGCDVFVVGPLRYTAQMRLRPDPEAVKSWSQAEQLDHMLEVVSHAVEIETADGQRLSGAAVREAVDRLSSSGSLAVWLYVEVTHQSRPGGADAGRFRSTG